MTFEPTTDLELVRTIVTHPKLYPMLSDDFSPAREEYVPLEHPAVTYLLAKDGQEVLGLWMLVEQSPVITEVHTCLLPSSWGARAAAAAKGGMSWVFEHTGVQLLITHVPQYNRLACRFARAARMTELGRLPKSFRKNNELHDQILLGVSREEFERCH